MRNRNHWMTLGIAFACLIVAFVLIAPRRASAAESLQRCERVTVDGRYGVIVLEGQRASLPADQELPIDGLWIPDRAPAWSGSDQPRVKDVVLGPLRLARVIEVLSAAFDAQVDGDFERMLACYNENDREGIRSAVGDRVADWSAAVREPKSWSLRVVAVVDQHVVAVVSSTDALGAYAFVFSDDGWLTTRELPARVDTVLTDLVRETCREDADVAKRLRASLRTD